MKVVVDANIVFSALLTSQGKLAEILTNPGNLELISPAFLRLEIQKHTSKIAKITKLSAEEVMELEYIITKNILFFSEDIISPKIWPKAESLVEDVDANDTPYIAFALHFKAKLWTGDKKLVKGLSRKNFKHLIETNELRQIRDRTSAKK